MAGFCTNLFKTNIVNILIFRDSEVSGRTLYFYSILSKTSENGKSSTDYRLTIEMVKEIGLKVVSKFGKRFEWRSK